MDQSKVQRKSSDYKQVFPKMYIRHAVLPADISDLLKMNSLLMNRWEIFAKIGQGAHGEVYAAYDRTLKRDVAIKAYRDYQHFKSETEIVKKLNGLDNFCKFIFEDSYTYMVMDLKGPTLKQVINNYAPFSYNTTLRLGLQMVVTIEQMHKRGIIHNDIKPANFVIGLPPLDWNNIYLVDFSLAERFDVSIASKKQIKKYNQNKNLGFVHDTSRRYDMNRLLHVLIQMRMELPWDYEALKSKTSNLLMEHFGEDFVDFKSRLDRLQDRGEPDYKALKSAISNLTESKRLNLSRKTEWERNPHKLWTVIYVRSNEKLSNKYHFSPSKSVPVLPCFNSSEHNGLSSLETTTKGQVLGGMGHPSSDDVACPTSSLPEIPSKFKIIQQNVAEHLLPSTAQVDKLMPTKARLYPQRPTPQKMDTIKLRQTHSRRYSTPEVKLEHFSFGPQDVNSKNIASREKSGQQKNSDNIKSNPQDSFRRKENKMKSDMSNQTLSYTSSIKNQPLSAHTTLGASGTSTLLAPHNATHAHANASKNKPDLKVNSSNHITDASEIMQKENGRNPTASNLLNNKQKKTDNNHKKN